MILRLKIMEIENMDTHGNSPISIVLVINTFLMSIFIGYTIFIKPNNIFKDKN